MKTLLQNPLFYLSVVLTIFVSWAAVGFVTAQVSQWHAPTQPFPNQPEVGVPLTTGDDPQTKTGTLTLSTGTSNAALRIEGGSTICLPSEVGGTLACKQAWNQIGTPGAASQWLSSGNDVYFEGGNVAIKSTTTQGQITTAYYSLVSQESSVSEEAVRLSCDQDPQKVECEPSLTASTTSPAIAYDELKKVCLSPLQPLQPITVGPRGNPNVPPPLCTYYNKYELQILNTPQEIKNGGNLSVDGNLVIGGKIIQLVESQRARCPVYLDTGSRALGRKSWEGSGASKFELYSGFINKNGLRVNETTGNNDEYLYYSRCRENTDGTVTFFDPIIKDSGPDNLMYAKYFSLDRYVAGSDLVVTQREITPITTNQYAYWPIAVDPNNRKAASERELFCGEFGLVSAENGTYSINQVNTSIIRLVEATAQGTWQYISRGANQYKIVSLSCAAPTTTP